MLPSSLSRALMKTAAGVLLMLARVCGHGRLWEPPSRSSMWRRGYNAPVNYNDNELFCGGYTVQYQQNGGKCGICGDPWNGARENEAGGRYAKGIIVRKYTTGQVINVTVDLTANHKGYFEFRLCPTDNPFERITHDCLANYPLVEISTGKLRYPVPNTQYNSKIEMKLQLPKSVTCRACLLQWKYNAGNSWGTNPDGASCVGCGDQEQFYGCADVAIGHDDVELAKEPDRHPWYFEVDDEWHYGIVRYSTDDKVTSNTVKSVATRHVLYDNTLRACFVSVIYLSTFVLVWYVSL